MKFLALAGAACALAVAFVAATSAATTGPFTFKAGKPKLTITDAAGKPVLKLTAGALTELAPDGTVVRSLASPAGGTWTAAPCTFVGTVRTCTVSYQAGDYRWEISMSHDTSDPSSEVAVQYSLDLTGWPFSDTSNSLAHSIAVEGRAAAGASITNPVEALYNSTDFDPIQSMVTPTEKGQVITYTFSFFERVTLVPALGLPTITFGG